MSKNQAAYMRVIQDDSIQDGPYLIPVKIGDVVYIADIDRQGRGTLDITAAALTPFDADRYGPPYGYATPGNNVSITQLGQAVITRIFTLHELELDHNIGGTFLLIHVQPIED